MCLRRQSHSCSPSMFHKANQPFENTHGTPTILLSGHHRKEHTFEQRCGLCLTLGCWSVLIAAFRVDLGMPLKKIGQWYVKAWNYAWMNAGNSLSHQMLGQNEAMPLVRYQRIGRCILLTTHMWSKSQADLIELLLIIDIDNWYS